MLPAITNTNKSSLQNLKFTKITSKTTAAPATHHDPISVNDTCPGKQLQVDTQPDPENDNADNGSNQEGDSLSRYSVSPAPAPPTPSSDTVSAHLRDGGELSKSDIMVTNFLECLQANAQAQKQSPSVHEPNVPTMVTKYTPQPIGGFPLVYGCNSTYPFDNIDIQQITDWMSLPGPRVFIQPLSHGYYPPAIAQEIVSILKTTITDIFGCANPKITAPMAPTYADQPPYTYLVHNIPPGVVTDLVK